MIKIPPKPPNEEEIDALLVGRFRQWTGVNHIDMKDPNDTCIPIRMRFVIIREKHDIRVSAWVD